MGHLLKNNIVQQTALRKSVEKETMIAYQQKEYLGSGIFKLLQLSGNTQFSYHENKT